MAYVDKINVEGNSYDLGKPIYYHGLDIYNSSLGNSIQMHILKNDNTPINSIALLKAWAENIPSDVYMQCNGCIVVENVGKPCYMILKHEGNPATYDIFYVGSTGYQALRNVDLSDYFSSVTDNSNKIN